MLQPFQVDHLAEFVLWKMAPPGAGLYDDDYAPISLRFHRPQSEKVVKAVLPRGSAGDAL